MIRASRFEDHSLFLDHPALPPLDPRNPYDELSRLRAAAPVRVDPNRFDESGAPLCFIYGHAEASRALRDNEIFSSAPLRDALAYEGDRVLLAMDPPEHAAYRRAILPSFQPRTVKRWQEGLIRAITDGLIGSFSPESRADLVEQFTFRFPAQVIAEILGVRKEDHDRFQHWTASLLGGFANPAAARAASRGIQEYFSGFVAERRANPSDDFISELVQAAVDGTPLSDDDMDAYLHLMLIAGIDNTMRTLGNLLFLILCDQELAARVKEDRSLISKAIDETMRFESSALVAQRRALRAVKLGDVDVPAGAHVWVYLAAANRDPEVWSDPDVFEVDRPNAGSHLSFGYGAHFCVGRLLAKTEMTTAVNTLFDLLPGLRFDWERAASIDAHIHGAFMRGPTALPVRWNN
jgi:cytochrome P450